MSKLNKVMVEEAVADLASIRGSIEGLSVAPGAIPKSALALDTNLFIQGLLLAFSGALLGVELFTSNSMTDLMMQSARFTEIASMGLAQVGLVLPAMVLCVYYVAWRAASRSGRGLQKFLGRDFQYLRQIAFFSDLLSKLAPVALLVLAGQPQVVAPLMVLYVGDSILQGRLFTFPAKLGIPLGSLVVGGSFFFYLRGVTELVWPLAIFSAVTALSISLLVHARSSKS